MEKRLIGFLPGSFDPLTLGHVDIVTRATAFCVKLYVGIAQNPSKQGQLFTPQERVGLILQSLPGMSGLEIISFEGLAVDTAASLGANCIFRGIRSASDAEYEFRMAVANRKVSGIDTLFLMADERYGHISSSLIRQLGRGGKDLTAFVPAVIESQVRERLSHLR